MLAQRSNQFVLLTIVLAIALVTLTVMVGRGISSQSSIASVSQATSAVAAAPGATVEGNVETAKLLAQNHQQVGGLAPNWKIFQASLNYADYPSMWLKNREIASYLKFNHQANGFASNWNIYQASLNYADYPSNYLPAFPTYGEPEYGPY